MTIRPFFAALLLAGSPLFVMAAPPPAAAPQALLETLQARMNLTPAQQPAWDAYLAASQTANEDRLERMRQLHDIMDAPGKATDRSQHELELAQRHAEHLVSRQTALNTLYAQLDPAQRKVLDDLPQTIKSSLPSRLDKQPG